MSDVMELMLRAVAEACFNMPADFTTKDIYKRITKDCDNNKVTQCVLKEMFCENTGTHFLDSGGAYGRGWQRSQSIKDLDWMEAERTVVNVDHYNDNYSMYITKNSYLFLCEQLEYDAKMDKRFHKFAETNRECWYQNMRDFIKYIDQFDGVEIKGSHNTYNGDSCLDKTLQWEMFEMDDVCYMILQIHNGCDVRGGYSAPHVFALEFDNFWCMIDDLTARCPNHGRTYPEPANPEGVQLDLEGNPTKDPLIDLDHVDCSSDDCGYHWYGNCGEDLDTGSKFITDEEGNHKIVCKKCNSEIEFW